MWVSVSLCHLVTLWYTSWMCNAYSIRYSKAKTKRVVATDLVLLVLCLRVVSFPSVSHRRAGSGRFVARRLVPLSNLLRRALSRNFKLFNPTREGLLYAKLELFAGSFFPALARDLTAMPLWHS